MSVEKSLYIRADAASVLASISRALGELVARIPGDIRRPTDLQRALGVDYKLCWQVFNITRTDNPLAVSQYVPGYTSIKKLLAAAKGLGVSAEVLLEVDQAMKEFQEVVTAHSSDRQAFDSMLASISGGDAAETLTLQHRRNAFRSESQIWGMQVETHLRQMIVRPSADGQRTDTCFINGKYGLRRLRRDVMPIVHGYREMSSNVVAPEVIEPLDPMAADICGAPVLEQFCTQPVPSFHTIQNIDGWIYSALDSDQIGRKSTVNLVFGGVVRNVPIENDEEGVPTLRCGSAYIAPTELGILEMLVHRPSYGQVVPQFKVQATAAGTDVPEIMRRTQPFLMHEKVMAMGRADAIPQIAAVPRYLSQLEYVFAELGWDPTEFDVFRLRLDYPILHTRVRLHFPVTRP